MSQILHTLLFSLPFVWIGCLTRLGTPGPKSTYRICLVIAIVGGLLGGIFGKDFGLGQYGGFFPPVIGIAAVCTFAKLRMAWMKRLCETALDVRGFGIRLFDQLDTDGNGVITALDILDFEQRYDGILPKDDAVLFELLVKNLSIIGHVVDSRIGIMPAPMGGAVAIDIHGISRQDLEKWPSKISTNMADEFGL
jgi:hypothetical protein